MIDKPRIYPHPSLVRACANCEDLLAKSNAKKVLGLRCKRYKQAVDKNLALNGKYPDFCKLYGENGIDRNRIYPDPVTVYTCFNCPAHRRDPTWKDGEIPIRYKCFEYNQPITVDMELFDKFPTFCKLKEKRE